MLASIARVVRGVSLGIWLGGLIMTFIAADQVFFRSGLDRATAGNVMGGILHVGGLMKVALAVLAVGSQIVLRKQNESPSRKRTITFVALLVAAALAFIAAFYLEPKLLELRAQFDTAPGARAEFSRFHGISMGMATLETVLVALALICVLL